VGAVHGWTNVVIRWSEMLPTSQDVSHILMGQMSESGLVTDCHSRVYTELSVIWVFEQASLWTGMC